MEDLNIILTIVALIIFLGVVWFITKKTKDIPEIIELPSKEDYSGLEMSILSKINRVRKDEKLNVLKLNDKVSFICQSHIDECIKDGKISHNNVGYRFSGIKNALSTENLGEVLAYGYRNSESVVGGLLKSPDHKEKLLGDFNQMGISAKKDRKGKMYVGIILIKVK